ncbi:hypothetical protein GCM10010465_28110 [Actinomadura fibrosa]
MRVRLFFILFPLFLASCGSHRQAISSVPNEPEIQKEVVTEEPEFIQEETYNTEVENYDEDRVPLVLEHALGFLGTRYRYGGASAEGMDCSGLVNTAFLKENIVLPRSSREMSLVGTRLNIEELVPGDLVFFDTGKKRKVVNHVGLVTELADNRIYFIHSTTSRGVIISSLDEAYWKEHFIMARRIE